MVTKSTVYIFPFVLITLKVKNKNHFVICLEDEVELFYMFTAYFLFHTVIATLMNVVGKVFFNCILLCNSSLGIVLVSVHN